MAGTIVITKETRDIAGDRAAEVLINLACTSDSADGTIPDQILLGLGEYALDELTPVPNATVITAAFSAIIVDDNGGEIYDSGSIGTTDNVPLDGPTGSATSHPARMDDAPTIKFVQPGDHAVAQDVGSSKKIDLVLRFFKK